MNVQFSFTASGGKASTYTPSSTAPVKDVIPDNAGSLPPTAPLIHTTQLNTLEKQGTAVSVGEEQLIRTIEKAVKALQGPSTTLEVSIHEKTHAIMVKVLNKDTGELIREVPPEKTLDLVAKMMELAGIIIDEKV
ncbi:flagellar protein FlaG [Paenibacillus sp. FSL R5-0912]|uniref:flagellar protein FlaG n=1 Tax=Paenibacillus sp. FSL R5-0912 TaxID=1536771 RepID=UPI0004F85A75|nr:flagellar protein FlaG [Paenibacillus sp. FSL R5-0912]AIQ44014.1 hypothetical protein R50912_31520 [Paenibacillus sp. FSL R5-0912]